MNILAWKVCLQVEKVEKAIGRSKSGLQAVYREGEAINDDNRKMEARSERLSLCS